MFTSITLKPRILRYHARGNVTPIASKLDEIWGRHIDPLGCSRRNLLSKAAWNGCIVCAALVGDTFAAHPLVESDR